MGDQQFNVDVVRKQFPALGQPQVFFDNAGGTQILGSVADSCVNKTIPAYLLTAAP